MNINHKEPPEALTILNNRRQRTAWDARAPRFEQADADLLRALEALSGYIFPEADADVIYPRDAELARIAMDLQAAASALLDLIAPASETARALDPQAEVAIL